MAELTTVRLADGTTYQIPGGEYGTAPWARQASLIAVAYRQIGDTAKADEWGRIAERRNLIWRTIESGKDKLEVLTQFGRDLIAAPVLIAADIGRLSALVILAAVALIVLALRSPNTAPIIRAVRGR